MKAAARSTFYANASDLRAIQDVVKRHNMRFVSNPASWVGKMNRMSVTIEADDIDDFSAGVAAIDLITQPKPEAIKVSWWRRIFN